MRQPGRPGFRHTALGLQLGRAPDTLRSPAHPELSQLSLFCSVFIPPSWQASAASPARRALSSPSDCASARADVCAVQILNVMTPPGTVRQTPVQSCAAHGLHGRPRRPCRHLLLTPLLTRSSLELCDAGVVVQLSQENAEPGEVTLAKDACLLDDQVQTCSSTGRCEVVELCKNELNLCFRAS